VMGDHRNSHHPTPALSGVIPIPRA
jgi:hypothetical protein